MSVRPKYLNSLSDLERHLLDRQNSILIFDRTLLRAVPGFKKIIKNFRYVYPVTAGEGLKSLSSFAKLADRIHKDVAHEAHRDWTVVAMGGGSVGDAAGFFASVYKRGLRLTHVPTTWLSAIDSSHGGKTALNLGGVKNQIGTFYEAHQVLIVREILQALKPQLARDAMGELAKIALLDRRVKIGKTGSESMWKSLPSSIAAKQRIVAKDPHETKGVRQLLNLGHTMGHVFEASFKISHGRAVGLGLLFAVDMSVAQRTLSPLRAKKIVAWLGSLGLEKTKTRISRKSAEALLRADKKRSQKDSIGFILIRGIGRCERKFLRIQDIIAVGVSQGWLK